MTSSQRDVMIAVLQADPVHGHVAPGGAKAGGGRLSHSLLQVRAIFVLFLFVIVYLWCPTTIILIPQ